MTKNIKPFIKNQFPKYILETDSLFPDFVEAYYEWTNLNNNYQAVSYDLETIPNIDVAYNKFAEEFISEYIDTIPEDVLVDKTTLIKKINELYKAKGTPKAVKFLVRILTNQDSEVFYPSTQIFKSSDAVWNRNISVRFYLTSGILTTFESIIAKITTPQSEFNIGVVKIQRVKNTTNLFEAFLDTKYKLIIPDGGTISSDTFTGELVRSTYKTEIKSRGSKFAVGDIFEINNSGGTGTKIKVTRVDSNTGLRSFDIVEFGVGYESSFITELEPLVTISDANQIKNLNIKLLTDDIVTQNIDISTDDNISEIRDTILISKFNYTNTNSYFEDNTYTSDTKFTSTDIASSEESVDNIFATILFELGYVFEYPGYYSTNTGFPSDTSYLQDGEYYQQFSYVVKSPAQFPQYETALKSLVHPAGLKVFGEYTINKQLDILLDIKDRLNTTRIEFQDNIDTFDEISSKIIVKSLQDTVQMLESISKTFSRTLQDTATIAESILVQLIKNFYDEVTYVDNIDFKTVDKNIIDTVQLLEIMIKDVEKTFAEELTSEDTGGILLNEHYYSVDDMILYGQPYWQFGYAENETIIT